MATTTASSTLVIPPESQPILAQDNENPLRQFRSYSYHFFLVACESTDVLDFLSSSKATNAFERTETMATLSPGQKDQPYPRNLITATDTNGKAIGNYVIVIDTRHDVDIIIDDVQWGTTFVGDGDSSGSSIALNVVMTDGVINFIEPRGVNFLNILASLGDQLNVDMICMPFCIKTIFYGHKESGQVIQLNSTQPFGFVPVDITGQVDERGTIYKMDIVGVVNGILHNPSFGAIVDNVSFPVINKQNFETHLATFTAKLNDTYKAQRELVLNATKSTIDLSAAAIVVYNIQLEPKSQILQYLNDFGTNQPDQLVVENGKHIIKGTKEGGIAQVIGKLLASSVNWMQTAAQGDPDSSSPDELNGRYTFKITQSFSSTSPSVTTQNVITANIYISEYKYSTVVVVSTPGGQQTQEPQPKIDPSQVITFDYIFTGKNIDIVGMQINLDMGLSLLQTLATAKSIYPQADDATGVQNSLPTTVPSAAPVAGPFNIQGKVRKGTPIFAPLQWAADYLQQMKDVQSAATAESIWKNFASYQSVNTTLTIHGNPLLLAKTIDPNRTIPNYVKVKIKMPNTPDDIWEYQLGSNQTPGGYYKNFWYEGYYIIISAVNKFEGGLFTQELDLVSLPQTSNTQDSSAAIDAAIDNVENARQHFFNISPTASTNTNTTPTGIVTSPTSSSSGGKLGTPGKNPTSPTHQAFVANYWNAALQSSQTSGLNPDFALAQAAVETGWGTNNYSQNYSSFFNIRSYNTTPNSYWGGTIIPGSGTPPKTPAFRSYDNPTDSFLDQSQWLQKLYPTSANATDINTYANGLMAGVGNRHWTATNQDTYVSNIVNAYNRIQTYKANLGIQSNQYYTGAPIPSATTPTTNYVATNSSTSSSGNSTSTSSTTYATNRTVAEAGIAQKATVFAPIL